MIYNVNDRGKGDGRVEGGGVHESTKLFVVFPGGELRLIYLFSLLADYRCFGSLCFRHFQLFDFHGHNTGCL